MILGGEIGIEIKKDFMQMSKITKSLFRILKRTSFNNGGKAG